MKKKYLVGPFLCSFAAWVIGNGTVPLVPLYAMERGASAAGSGLFMAFAFGCLALGTVAPSALPRRCARRRLLVAAAGGAWALVALLISQTRTLLSFAAFAGAGYFLAGIVFSQSAVLTGLAAPEKERGTAMGVLGMTNGLGALVGGMFGGLLAQRFGFAGLWQGAAAACLLVVAGGIISLEAPPGAAPAPAPAAPREHGAPHLPRPAAALGAALVLLLLSQLLLSVTNATANLGRALCMDQHGLSKLAINSTQAVSGAVALGLPLLLGWISDRVGRRWILAGCYLLSAAGLVVLAYATALWQFYLFAALNAFLSVPFGVGPAYVMDVVPGEGAARGVALFQAMNWVGNICGMAGGGLAAQRLGISPTVLYSAGFAVAAMALLFFVRERRAAPTAVPSARATP
jgi:MFS family permease